MSEKQKPEPTIKLPAELKALEAELAALVPEDKPLDRARLLYAAGSAAARRRARGWAAAFGAMSTVSVALLISLLARPVKIVDRIVLMPAKAAPRMPGPKQSDGPENDSIAEAETGVAGAERSDAPEYLPLYPMPEKTNFFAAVFFGAENDLTGPIRRRPRWSVLQRGGLLEDFDSDADLEETSPVSTRRQSPLPKPREPKSYRALFDELIKTHG